MTLNEFLKLEPIHQLSPSQAQDLNDELSGADINDIPVGHRSRVLDYLVTALNMNSVSIETRQKLDELCQSLQQSDNR